MAGVVAFKHRRRVNSFKQSPMIGRAGIGEGPAPSMLDASKLQDGDIGRVKIATEEDALKMGVLQKRIVAETVTWRDRFLCLTRNAVEVCDTDPHVVRDFIDLEDISEIMTGVQAKKFEDPKMHRTNPTSSLEASPAIQGGHQSVLGDPSLGVDRQDLGEWVHSFAIKVDKRKRAYYFRTKDEKESLEWIDAIKAAQKECATKRRRESTKTISQKTQRWARQAYSSQPYEFGLCFVLITNFVVSIAETEMTAQNKDPELVHIFNLIDYVYTGVYTLELFFNLFANWRTFNTSWWNFIDTLVVILSVTLMILDIVNPPATGEGGFPATTIRLVRVFKVVRIFGRLRKLNEILTAIAATIMPVFHSCILVGVIVSIYAVLGTSIYADAFPEKFGSWTITAMTCVQVATFDSWSALLSELKTRPGVSGIGADAFFNTYIVIVGIVCMNVVIAVFFLSAMEIAEMKVREEIANLQLFRVAGPLDDLLEGLSNFTSAVHLHNQIESLFTLLDVDNTGGLSREEMTDGLEQNYHVLGLTAPVVFSHEDFEAFTQGYRLCNDAGELCYEHFTQATQIELVRYCQRQTAARMQQSVEAHQDDKVSFLALKLQLAEGILEQANHSTLMTIPAQDLTPTAFPKVIDWPRIGSHPSDVPDMPKIEEGVDPTCGKWKSSILLSRTGSSKPGAFGESFKIRR